jgi:hypothetical protein
MHWFHLSESSAKVVQSAGIVNLPRGGQRTAPWRWRAFLIEGRAQLENTYQP